MPSQFVVSTVPIRSELRKAARKLLKLEKKATAPKLQEIQLELKLLKSCFNKLGNVKWP